MNPCCSTTLESLAIAIKKSLPPQRFEKLLEELKWSTDPLAEFLKVLKHD